MLARLLASLYFLLRLSLSLCVSVSLSVCLSVCLVSLLLCSIMWFKTSIEKTKMYFVWIAMIVVIYDWFFHLFCIGTGMVFDDSTLLSIGVVGFVHLLCFGCDAVRIPRKRIRGRHRQRNMRTQLGHTQMLMYFIGVGPLSEVYMSPTGSKRTKQIYFMEATKHFTFYFLVPIAILYVSAGMLVHDTTVVKLSVLFDEHVSNRSIDIKILSFVSCFHAILIGLWARVLLFISDPAES